MPNILTFDIEEARHMNFGGQNIASDPAGLARGLDSILKMLTDSKAKATFFIVGDLIEPNKDLIRRVANAGHELAFHGMSHKLVYNMSESEFDADISIGKKMLESISGEKVIGYRAPSWSVSAKQTPRFWEILKRVGFEYSSSLFPLKTPLYGDNHAPRFPHFRGTKHGKILEIPVPTARFIKNIPFSGGAYFRYLADWERKILEYFWNVSGCPIVYYFHMRDLDLEKSSPEARLMSRVINYWGNARARKRFENLLRYSKFTTISEALPILRKFDSTGAK